MDSRWQTAVDASVAWYDDVFARHGIPTRAGGGVWRALGQPPPYHSVAKTLRPRASAEIVLEAVAEFGQCSVADSFGDLALPGFDVLFEATWVHHPGAASRGLPTGWTVLTDPDSLAEWNRLHDYVGVLTAGVLAHPRFSVLGRYEGATLTGGAVLHDAGASVGLSNAWSLDPAGVDWEQVLAAAHAVHPGRELTDYETDDQLPALVTAGFTLLGPQVVWAR